MTPAILGMLGFVLLCEQPAHAYIDPGSGSLLYQAILAAVLGVGFKFRRMLGTLNRVGRRRETPVTPATEGSHLEPHDGRA